MQVALVNRDVFVLLSLTEEMIEGKTCVDLFISKCCVRSNGKLQLSEYVPVTNKTSCYRPCIGVDIGVEGREVIG